MIPSSFDGENGVLDAPQGMESCDALSVLRGHTAGGEPVVISCWKPTKEEIEEIAKTGRVWLMLWGQTMAPACITGFRPFEFK